MKTNVTYLETKYHINQKKAKVHCLLEFGIDLTKIPGIEHLLVMPRFIKYIEDLTNKYTGVAAFIRIPKGSDVGIVVFKTDGLACCSKKDKFDVALGKKIASTRAQKKSFLIARDFYDTILNIIDTDYYVKIENMYLNCIKTFDKCSNHEKDLVK